MTAELSDCDFGKIRRFMYETYGINLHDGKKELVRARLGRRLRQGKFGSFTEYLDFVTGTGGVDELTAMIDSLSTNLTGFFREENHFDCLRRIIADMTESARSLPMLRIWCAGCSTGEEAYSLAMTVREHLKVQNCATRIVATDISTRVLRTAVKGVYRADRIGSIPDALVKKYFQIGSGTRRGYYRVKKDLRDMVTFERFNLMDTPPFRDSFDTIFCRNVMIYFDKKTQERLIARLYDALETGGWLFIGHSESLTGMQHRFTYVEPNVYRKGENR